MLTTSKKASQSKKASHIRNQRNDAPHQHILKMASFTLLLIFGLVLMAMLDGALAT